MKGGLTLMVAALMLATSACASEPAEIEAPTPTASPTTSPAPPTEIPASSTETTAPTTTTPPSIDALLVIGDSVAGQVFQGLDQRSQARGGPPVRYLLSAGPHFADGWPEPMPEFIDDPATTAVMVSFGVWLATPPDHVADEVAALTEAETSADIEAYLRPIVDLGSPHAELLLLSDIDHPEANTHIQAANSLIEAEAVRLGLTVHRLLPGTVDGEPNRVDLAGAEYPVRNGTDATHFCGAAALVMADTILDRLAVDGEPATSADLTELMEATAGSNTFTAEGCG
ncbi:MAG: hypothetical protein ACR2QE_05220 [Acidimicrobiales bacterium]